MNSRRIVGLEVEIPTMTVAILRQVLLPITVHALGSPATRRDWGRRFECGEFDGSELAALERYLGEYADRFDVLHPRTPFAQVADLHTAKGETKGAALLVATAPAGNNVPLFAERTEADALALPLDVAVRWMLHVLCWDTAAIKTGVVGDPKAKAGKTSGNHTGPLGQLGVVMPIGRTLYETLLLNTPIGAQKRLGAPQWARGPLGPEWAVRAPDGLLDLWTFPSRRVRMFVEHSDSGAVVERVLVAAGDRFSAGVPSWEPHTAWRHDKPVKGAAAGPPRPMRHAAGKAAWRGLNALLALDSPVAEGVSTSELLVQVAGLEVDGALDDGYPLRVQTCGIVYGNQSAVIEDVIVDEIPVPVAALRGEGLAYEVVVEAAGQAERLTAALNMLSADLRRALGAEPIPWDKGMRPGEQLLLALDPLVRRLLAGVAADSGDEDKLARGRVAWETLAYDTVYRCAAPLFALPAAAFMGRTIKSGSKEQHYRLGLAANSFRSAVKSTLPRAAAARQHSNTKE